MSFLIPAPFAYLSGTSSYPLDGLMALYNIANISSYTSGSSTVYDLSGNGNNLLITGSVNYVAASSSLQITGSTTSSYGQIYSPNQLTIPSGSGLLGTGSVFTVIMFQQSVGQMQYNPNWYIGGQTQGAAYKQITNQQFGNFGTFKLTFGSQTGNSSPYDQFSGLYSVANPNIPDTGKYYSWGDASSSTFGNRKWSMQAFSKSSQASTLNLNFHIRGYYTNSTWNSSSLASMTLSGVPTSAAPVVIGGNYQTTFQTNLDSSFLYIGKNPMYSTTLPVFMFGGMAIYNRPLSATEVNTLWSYFISGRTP